MPRKTLNLELKPGERLVAELDYIPNGKIQDEYVFAVSDQALYAYAKKRGLVLVNPWYVKNVPLTTVKFVRIRAASSIGFFFSAGVFLLIFGAAFVLYPLDFADIAVIFFAGLGLYAHRVSRNIRALAIETAEGKYSICMPIALPSTCTELEMEVFQEAFLETCRKVGVRIIHV